MNWVVTTRLKVCQLIRRPWVFELALGIDRGRAPELVRLAEVA